MRTILLSIVTLFALPSLLLMGVLLTGCGESKPPASLVKRSPRETLQLVGEQLERHLESLDEIQTLGGQEFRTEFLVDEITKPVFHEPEQEDGNLTAEITVRIRLIVTSLELGGLKSDLKQPAASPSSKDTSPQADDKTPENTESELQKIARQEIVRKNQTQVTNRTEILEFEYVDELWVLTSTDISEGVLEDVKLALQIQ